MTNPTHLPSPERGTPSGAAHRARVILDLHRAQRAGVPVTITTTSGSTITGRVHSTTTNSTWLLVPPDAADPGDVFVMLRDVLDVDQHDRKGA